MSKCFGAKLCILQSVIFIFGSPKTDATFGDVFKGGFRNILCIKQRGWEQCEVALHKVALRTRPVEGCPFVSLPCQSVLGLNCVYLYLLFAFLGSPKSDATFGDDFKRKVKKYPCIKQRGLEEWVGTM